MGIKDPPRRVQNTNGLQTQGSVLGLFWEVCSGLFWAVLGSVLVGPKQTAGAVPGLFWSRTDQISVLAEILKKNLAEFSWR